VTTHSTTRLPTAQGAFTLRTYHSALSGETHCALVAGDLLDNPPGDEPVLVRVHSECLTGDAFGSQRCDCGQQLQTAMARVQQEQRGAVLYMRQEGRGIGLAAKMQAYVLQDQGLDTVEANHQLGYAADPRDYAVAAQMLSDLGIQRVRLLTNNPEKVEQLERCGIEVVERISIESEANAHNSRYLQTKREKMGHLLTGLEE
jgi:3,4-dihydroxy 2-butanone 4-phosphate synthase/GTP cyclohydrolase II